MSYKYIKNFGDFFWEIYTSLSYLTPSECIYHAMDKHSRELILKELHLFEQIGFSLDLYQLAKDEIRTIFHKDNLDTFRKLFPYISGSGKLVVPFMLINFFNIKTKDLNQLFSYLIEKDLNLRGGWHDRDLAYLMQRFEIPLWDEEGICEKAIQLGILIDKKMITTFTESDILKISNNNLCNAGREYLAKRFNSKNKTDRKIITHLFLDGKDKFCSLKQASIRLYPDNYSGPILSEAKVNILKTFDHDLDLIKNTMKTSGYFLRYVPSSIIKTISNTKDFFISAGPHAAKYASKQLLDDEEVAMHLLSIDCESLPYISLRLRDDYKFLMKFYKKNDNGWLQISESRWQWWKKRKCYLSASVLDNKWFIKEHLKRVPEDYIFISERLKKDLAILELTNPFYHLKNLECAGKNILNNRDFILPFIKKFKYPFKWVSKKLRDDYELCDMAVTRYGSYIQYGSDRLKNDKKLALKAVSGSYSSYQYLSKNMKKDTDVITAAIQRNEKVCKYIPKEIRQDKKLWMDMIEKRTLPIRSIFFACHFSLRRDPDIYEKVLNQDPSLAGYYSEKILINFNFKNINKSSRQVIYNIVFAASGKEDIFFLAWAKKHILEF
jgi:hypothetical protein